MILKNNGHIGFVVGNEEADSQKLNLLHPNYRIRLVGNQEMNNFTPEKI